jgi:hypothetical protein
MISIGEIRDAINKLLIDKLGAKTVYIDRCPVDFRRPSYWLEAVRREVSDANFCTVKVKQFFSITCFVSKDEYGNSKSMALTDAQNAVADLFACGYMRVGDRAIQAKATTSGYENDRSFVNLEFEYLDDRPEEESNDSSKMGDFEFELKE